MSDFKSCLANLASALDDYLESGQYEPVMPGHPVHNAVVEAEVCRLQYLSTTPDDRWLQQDPPRYCLPRGCENQGESNRRGLGDWWNLVRYSRSSGQTYAAWQSACKLRDWAYRWSHPDAPEHPYLRTVGK